MNRRGFLGAILAAGVAPAFVRADSLMKLVVPSKEIIIPYAGNRLLTIEMVTKEALLILNLMFTRAVADSTKGVDECEFNDVVRIKQPLTFSER